MPLRNVVHGYAVYFPSLISLIRAEISLICIENLQMHNVSLFYLKNHDQKILCLLQRQSIVYHIPVFSIAGLWYHNLHQTMLHQHILFAHLEVRPHSMHDLLVMMILF